MKLQSPINEAYAATIVKLDHTHPLENSDNLVGARFFGYNAVIPKSYEPGFYVMFSAETQLAHAYCHANNLYRKSDLNKDQSKKAYIEENRRIRAIKLRGNTSNCVIMPLESLEYTGANVSELKLNDTFDHLNGVEICRKYAVKTTEPKALRSQSPKFSRVDKRLMPEHIKTVQYWRYQKEFNSRFVVVTQKLHGTSIRLSNIPVSRPLTIREKIAKKFGVKVDDHVYDYVYGSRRVIKDVNDPDKNHFYDVDLWSKVGEKHRDVIPKNYILYGEIIGWVDEHKPIQPDYTYNLAPGKNELYIYRVATVNPDGVVADLSWDGVREFCIELGLRSVPELTRCFGHDLNVDDFMNRMYHSEGFNQAVPLSSNKTKDEGIAIRYEAQVPVVAKAKCSEFLEKETRDLDKNEMDVEQS